jgi:hypothetical protein
MAGAPALVAATLLMGRADLKVGTTYCPNPESRIPNPYFQGMRASRSPIATSSPLRIACGRGGHPGM